MHFHQIYHSEHYLLRLALLHVQFIYNIINFLFSSFSLAGFLLTLFGIIQVYFIMNVIYLFKRVADVRFKDSNQGAKNFEYINVYYSDIGDITVIVSGVAVVGVYIAAGFYTLIPNTFSRPTHNTFSLYPLTQTSSMYTP